MKKVVGFVWIVMMAARTPGGGGTRSGELVGRGGGQRPLRLR